MEGICGLTYFRLDFGGQNRVKMGSMHRRTILQSAVLLPATTALPAAQVSAQSPTESFPAHRIELAREVVGVSHGNFKRVQELVDAQPALARAAVDWGFGDWEDALGAASHVGNRQIAEYLIGKGARPSIFSAAMLGQLDVVKAFVAAQPGVQKISGPHSISLLAHAKAGAKQAEGVLAYLESLGDAGSQPAVTLSAAEMTSLAGVYVYGSKPSERIEVAERRGVLMFTRSGTSARNLTYLGDRAFYPVGAREVRIRFAASGEDMLLTVHDPDLIVTAKRTPAATN